MKKNKIFVAGHNGMVGSAIIRKLKKNKKNIIIVVNKKKVNLTNQKKVLSFLKKSKPNQIYIAAAKVGGIMANYKAPADFIYINSIIACNLIHSAMLLKIKKILFLGSSCIYPKVTKLPISEKQLLTSDLEITNEAYSIAKILGLKLCESYNRQYKKLGIDYRSVMPTNLYGINDSYHDEDSHVIPALLQRLHYAKKLKKKIVKVWGSGKAKRDFLYVDDLADACVYLMNISKKKFYKKNIYRNSHINIGSGKEISIKSLVKKISKIIGYKGKIIFDHTKPDGTLRKILNNKKLKEIGWKPKTSLTEGLKISYEDFQKKIS